MSKAKEIQRYFIDGEIFPNRKGHLVFYEDHIQKLQEQAKEIIKRINKYLAENYAIYDDGWKKIRNDIRKEYGVKEGKDENETRN